MRERRLILGIVRKVVRVRSIGMMQPLFEAAPDLSSWSREYDKEEVMEEFPNRGLVSWLAVRPSVEEGTVWQFGIEEQDFNADNPQHDEFRVASGASVVREVLMSGSSLTWISVGRSALSTHHRPPMPTTRNSEKLRN